jgi:hypothetical protein
MAEFYNKSFLPFLLQNVNAKLLNQLNFGATLYLYQTLACMTGMIADIVDMDALEENKQWQLNCTLQQKTASSVFTSTHISSLLTPWATLYLTVICDDFNHITAPDQAKSHKKYPQLALIRQAIYALVIEPTNEKAQILFAALSHAVNSRIISDFYKKDNHLFFYLKIVSLMRLCMQNLEAGLIYKNVNTAYTGFLLNIIINRGYTYNGLLYSELISAARNKNGLDPKIAAEAERHIKSYEKKHVSGVGIFSSSGPELATKKLVKSIAIHIDEDDRSLGNMRAAVRVSQSH